MEKILNFINKHFKINRVTAINIVFGLMIAVTPLEYVALSNTVTSTPNNLADGEANTTLLFIFGAIILFIWLADFWASRYRANIIYLNRKQQKNKGISLIAGLGYLHLFPSMALAGIIGTLLGASLGAIAVFTPVLVILALIKEPVLIQGIIKQRKEPKQNETKSKNLISDIILLLYAYFVFIVTWQSFVYSGSFQIDLSKSGGLFMVFFTTVIYLLFYIGACWIWFEDVLVSLQTRKQKLIFIGVFLFELLIVIVKLIK